MNRLESVLELSLLFYTIGNMQSVSSNAVAKALPLTTSASQVIWSGGGPYGPNTNSAILGTYGYGLFDIGLPYTSGYHKEFVLTAQITTDAGIGARVRLNNIATNYTVTWSGNQFRNIVYSQPFRYEDIIFEPTLQYGQNGTNLYVQTDSNAGNAWIYNVMITCYIVKDN